MSKELEALQRIKKFYPTWRLSNREAFNLVESALKALDIIKEKEVNVHYFKSACATMNYEQYLSMWNADCFVGIQMTSKTMLTQAEFNSLKKEVLS